MKFIFKNLPTLLFTSFLYLLPLNQAQAEDNTLTTSISVDGYNIYYNLFDSDFISPEIAKAYDIKRSAKEYLLNVSIVKNTSTANDIQGVKATISGTTNDLMRKDPIKFKEIIEKNAIYYIASIPTPFEQVLLFNLSVTPEGSDKTHDIEFKRTVHPKRN